MERTRRPWWPSIVALLIVACFGVYLWAWNDAQSAFADVRVVTDATPLQCSGIEPGYYEREVDTASRFSMHRIELRQTMNCQIEFHIQNLGTRQVDVDRAIIPFGAAGAQGALAVQIEPNTVMPGQVTGAVDAEFDLGLTMQPGEERSFTLSLTFQDGMCFANGSIVTFDDYVRVDMSRWLFSGSPGLTSVPIAFAAVGDTQGDGCPALAAVGE